MIARQLSLHYRLGKTIQSHNKTSTLLTKSTQPMSSISQWMRKFMNRIKFQDNRAIQASQDKVTLQILQTPKQVEEKFIGDQQFKSVVEKQRMRKIDEIIGTRTYFHQTKKYQQRLDSDHVMVIDDLAMKHPEPKREHLNWENTQAPQQYKVKSTRKFYKNLKNLRQYPKHDYRITQFTDEKSQENIEFLGKQSLFLKLSLKWVDTFQKSLENEVIDDKSYELHAYRYSQRFVYFATEYESSKLYRIPRGKFTQTLLRSPKNFEENKQQIEQVITMQEIYDVLKEYFHDERVTQWLKKVENGEIEYLLSGYKTNESEDGVMVWVDLLGTKKEYVHLYKRIGGQRKVNGKENVQNKNNDQKKKNEPTKSQDQKSIQGDITTHMPFSHPPTQFINRLIFNCKSQAAFSHHKNSIFLIQRGEQGSYVQLISVSIEANHSLGQPEIIYRCKLYEQIDLFQDEGMGCLFINVRNVSNGCVGRVFAVEEKHGQQQGGIQLVEIDITDLINEKLDETTDGEVTAQKKQGPQSSQGQQTVSQQKSTRLSLSTCPQGLIFTNFYPSKEYFKYGSNRQYATKIHLIPFKSHIQLMLESSNKLSQSHMLSGKVEKVKRVMSMKELDEGRKKVLFECPLQQFITEISVRQSHVIISLSTISIYNKKRLLFLPHDQSKNPHSLIFPSHSLQFFHTGYNYASQILSFFINRSLISNQYYQYTIWKKQLKEMTQDEMYLQKVKVNENVELHVMCLNKYLEHLPRFYAQGNEEDGEKALGVEKNSNYIIENSKVPILIYLVDSKHNNNSNNLTNLKQIHLRQFLQKGTLIITVSCRGMLTSDLITFYKGSGENIQSYLQDIQATIQWIGNNLGTNISLYANGYISSFVGMMINVRYPFLFTSTVLHNGVYQLLDEKTLISIPQIEYFMRFNNSHEESIQKQQKQIKFWQQYNVASLLFKRSKLATKKNIDEEPKAKFNQQEQYISNDSNNEFHDNTQQSLRLPTKTPTLKIGTLQNILISCSNTTLSKQQARRMIYHLRRNPHFRYQDVYLKEFIEGEDEQLFNLAYIYGKMRERLQLDSFSK